MAIRTGLLIVLTAIAQACAMLAGVGTMLLVVVFLFAEMGTSGPASMWPPAAALAYFVLDLAAIRAVMRPHPSRLAWIASFMLPFAGSSTVLHALDVF